MTPEEWKKARDVLAEALELKPGERAAFLDRVLPNEGALRGEVERLLSSSDEARSSFLGSSTSHVAVTPGTKLGEFEVLALVGAGGMGEVYRARDARLRRDVAIKVLPASVSADPERLRRFEQEARATAALNHPNILSIFQMGTYEGAPYLVSELLEGSTLREQLARGPLPMRKAIDYAAQVAHGLAAAHDKGVVHRDLKPENLFVTKDGLLKILDFGLAKLVQREWSACSDVPTETRGTDPGIVMGTVGYMAPEQVSGKAADHRADIFAFGAILYEALTGTRAFRKPTAPETMSAILNEDPRPASQLVAAIPPALQKVVHRCLEKNPTQRFQSASDLAFALEALSDSGAQSGLAPALERRKSHAAWWGAGALIAIVAMALGFVWMRSRSVLVPPTEWVQITNFADSVSSPSLSPDGRMLTFLRGDDTFTTAGQVYVMLLPHGEPVRLTNDSTAKMSPVFSPDGANVAYTVPWDTWIVPVLGGQPRIWLPNASGLTWLDADHVMFSQAITGTFLELVRSDLSRAHVQSIYKPKSQVGMIHRSYRSPDGKWVIAVEMNGNYWQRCRLLPFDGSTKGETIGPADGVCTAAAWSPDGKWMYLTSNSGGAFHIWRQRFPNGTIEKITSGPTEEEGIAFAPDGKSFITSVGTRHSSVWLHDATGDRELTSEATAGLPDNRNGSAFSPDGKKLYYIVSHTRHVHRSDAEVGELWDIDLQSGATEAVLPGFEVAEFCISPDGHTIVFTAVDNEGKPNIWLAPLDRSSSPQMLVQSAQRARVVGDWIYYVKRMPEKSYAHRVHLDGSGDEQIWNESILGIATSPDGRYLAINFPIQKGGVWKLEIVDWARKRVQPVCNDAAGYWTDDGKTLLVNAGIGKRNANAPTYAITLPTGNGIPVLPPNGVSSLSELDKVENARVIAPGVIAAGKSIDTYAYVKENVQRNLYWVPLR